MDCDRASSAQLLEHDWLKVKAHDFSYKMDDSDFAAAGHAHSMAGCSCVQQFDAADGVTMNSEATFS
jgi:hypothetical protein